MAFAHIANQEKQKKVKPSVVYAWQKYGIKEKKLASCIKITKELTKQKRI